MNDTSYGTRIRSIVMTENRYNDEECIQEEGCVDYGYEPVVSRPEFADASPRTITTTGSNRSSSLGLKNHHRRPSLKTSESYKPQRQRRASISYTGERKVRLSDNTIVKRRTSISFQDKDDVREIEPLTDETLWTTPVEYLQSKEEAKQVLRAIYHCYKTGGPKRHDEEKMCTRGLEHYLPGSRHRTQQSRSLVLKVQESQKTAGMTCDETLSRLYSHMTLKSAREARQLGARDFAEVKQEHRITKRLINRHATRRASMV
uniref:Uncharacterized protein n=1 Tax=Amphora coffeiformis TaxID=265554 RepID=A0A7S3L6P7_9STRA